MILTVAGLGAKLEDGSAVRVWAALGLPGGAQEWRKLMSTFYRFGPAQRAALLGALGKEFVGKLNA